MSVAHRVKTESVRNTCQTFFARIFLVYRLLVEETSYFVKVISREDKLF